MNVNEQTTTEVVGSATMAVTFLLSVVTMVTVLIDMENTNMVRALVTEVSMLLTIFLWNYNNNELRDHTKQMLNKIWKFN